MISAEKIALFLASIKIILNLFGYEVFSNEQAEAIANGVAAIVAVVLAIINKIKETQAQAELQLVRAELLNRRYN